MEEESRCISRARSRRIGYVYINIIVKIFYYGRIVSVYLYICIHIYLKVTNWALTNKLSHLCKKNTTQSYLQLQSNNESVA